MKDHIKPKLPEQRANLTNFYPPEVQDDNQNILIALLAGLLVLCALGWFIAESDNEILRTALAAQTHTQVPR